MTEQERRVVNHAMKILEQSQDDEARALAVKLLEQGTKVPLQKVQFYAAYCNGLRDGYSRIFELIQGGGWLAKVSKKEMPYFEAEKNAALSDTEAKIRKLKTERIYAYNKDGKEIAHSQTGKAHSTQLPFGYNYKDAIITHNHPNRGIGDTIAGRVGTILSGADIFTTIAHNASEIRAVTKNYTYSLKRPSKGWGLSESDAWDVFGKKNSQWRRTLQQKQTEYFSKSGIRNRINEKVLALNRKRSSFTKGGKVPSASDVSSYNREANEIQKRVTEANDRGNVGAQYQVMKEYAKKYGWNLIRKRTS